MQTKYIDKDGNIIYSMEEEATSPPIYAKYYQNAETPSRYTLILSNDDYTDTSLKLVKNCGNVANIDVSNNHGGNYTFNHKWGDINRKSVKEVIIHNKIVPTNTARWFYMMENLENIEGLENIDTSKVTDMKYMFERLQ